ncbi:MAG: dihydrofolate reductase [SAR86 cluster bacterium]|jgi:dihydrofolate reductase|nr:dihydrofolate reductase [SAR86 cluster bacterium]MBL6811069.1 dihydrofolate reductase [SAR86 cluster bacterium]
MIISSLVAMNADNVIGVNNDLPWKLKDDLQHFKNYSMNKAIIMGRNTYDSIGRPLPNRFNIVVSNTMAETEGLSIAKNLAEALELATDYSIAERQDEIVLIGGARIFDEGMKYVNKLVISWVDAPDIQGDVYFPNFDLAEWDQEKSENFAQSDVNEFSFKVVEYLKK